MSRDSSAGSEGQRSRARGRTCSLPMRMQEIMLQWCAELARCGCVQGLFFSARMVHRSKMAAEPLVTSRGIVIASEELEEQFIRASGPGGQNVNKVATAVQLRFNAAATPALDENQKRRLLALAGRRATRDGFIVIEASRFRTQERNRADALQRLAALIDQAVTPPPPPRKKTRPSRGAVERRLKAKAGRSQVKKMRGKVEGD